MTRPVTLVEPGTVRLERLLPGPIERVWSYITDSQKRSTWLAAGEFDLRVGGKIHLEFDNARLSKGQVPENRKGRGQGAFDGVITRLDAPRLLAHTWSWGEKGHASETEVTYELTPKGKDVLLVITHRRMPKELVTAVMGGWDVHSGILQDILQGKEPRSFWTEHDRLEKEYAAAL
jgi:uncharacterized protein YndB with AHSA1/START domain